MQHLISVLPFFTTQLLVFNLLGLWIGLLYLLQPEPHAINANLIGPLIG